jgi:hypothetical protein
MDKFRALYYRLDGASSQAQKSYDNYDESAVLSQDWYKGYLAGIRLAFDMAEELRTTAAE